jgi:hypothetical protein
LRDIETAFAVNSFLCQERWRFGPFEQYEFSASPSGTYSEQAIAIKALGVGYAA